jgi:SHS family lactate transporter-like MFS transporter
MSLVEPWGRAQRAVVVASFLAWMLDAFDFFLVVFVLRHLAAEFSTSVKAVTWAITLTLAMRPLGALIFGRVAERFGRRPALIGSVLMYSLMGMVSALAPSLGVFIALRALFGIAMGGEWGVGAALAFESVPVRSRGWVSGLLQCGYASGYLLAAIAFGLLFEHIGWRGLFFVGALPAALLVLYIVKAVPESPIWKARSAHSLPESAPGGMAGHWGIAVYAVLLMAIYNFFSHGTQDLYPTMLEAQRGFSVGTVSMIAIVYNVGAICGGLLFGRVSSRLGRRYTAALAALLALPALPFWAFAHSAIGVATAAFIVQAMMQGSWSIVPVHLNELSPASIRATFPGVVYQLGNLIASSNATLQASLAERMGSNAHPDYASALALFCGVVVVTLIIVVLLGPERRDVSFAVAPSATD